MILCSRCDFVGHVTGLLEHWDAVHGGWSVKYMNDVAVICPRECSSPGTEHCVGWLRRGHAKCWHCGRWMPLDDAIDFPWDEAS